MIKTVLLNIAIIISVSLLAYGATFWLAGRTPAPQPFQDAAKKTAPQTGDILPDFSFETLDGTQHNLHDFKGRIVVLNFWASWCAPCIKEFPALIRAANTYPDDVVLIALSSDFQREAIMRFINRIKKQDSLNLDSKNILIAQDAQQAITASLFQTYRLPETYVISPQMYTVHKYIGADWTQDDLLDTIAKVLDKKHRL